MSEDQISRRELFRRAGKAAKFVAASKAAQIAATSVFGLTVVHTGQQLIERGKDAVTPASETEKKYQEIKALRPQNLDLEEYKKPLGEFMDLANDKDKWQSDIKGMKLHITTTNAQGVLMVYEVDVDKNKKPVFLTYPLDDKLAASAAKFSGFTPKDLKKFQSEKVETFHLDMNYVDRAVNPQKEIGDVGPDPLFNFYEHTGKTLRVIHKEEFRVTPYREGMSIAIAETYNFIDTNVPKTPGGHNLATYQHTHHHDKINTESEWRKVPGQIRFLPEMDRMNVDTDPFGKSGVVIQDIDTNTQQLNNALYRIFHKPIK